MIPLFKPYMPELPELNEILHSGNLAYGKYSQEFESKLRDFFETPYVLCINDFQTAFSIAFKCLNLKYGDEVIASPMGCLVSTQPLLFNGLKVRWADVERNTGTLSYDDLRNKISNRTKCIVHNHFCGYPGKIDEINKIAKEYGIPVIDDGIEAFGSEYKGKKVGCCGTDITVFSLSAVRFLNCIEGGVLIFKEKSLYDKALLICDSGIDRLQFRDKQGEINPKCDISLVGYNAKMSNVNAYIGLKQFEVVDFLLKKSRIQAEKWASFLYENPKYKEIPSDDTLPNYWVYGFLTDDKRNTIEEFRKKGFYASGVHMRNDVYSVFGNERESFAGVDFFQNHFVAIPCGWWM